MRFLLNVVIKAFLLIVFNFFGWLTLTSNGEAVNQLNWSTFGTAALIAILFAVVSFFVIWGWIILILLTKGIAFLLVVVFPFFGWALLSLTAYFIPGAIQFHGFWLTALCGFLLMIVGVSRKSSS
ncbi:MAG: hypothetical protein ABIP74_04595 [Candidatus Saccharimonas sp.]